MTSNRAIPFDLAHIAGADEFHQATAEQFRQAIGPGVLMSLGATRLTAVPGRFDRGGLMFTARILPFTRTGDRYAAARNMAVLISTTPLDEIDVEVREYARGIEHAKIEGVYIDQLARAVLALDYDGPEPLNPRYWQ
ncbi:hypothetical protein [Gulosibacter molinativorax]|uniref:hypothetical protein n=1 Tax=Gulosibacter molinativorax TaxID=256821 RepID=UPI000D0B5D5A|nr:hypothetical protein [Gulosibacter molinativorax]QUY63938.1 Hypotetical protein [Gulosibacter molinativorax]